MLYSNSNIFISKKPSFGNLKENLRVGEKALKHFKTEYPYLRSSSYVKMKCDLHKDNSKYKNLTKRLKTLAMTYEFGVEINRKFAELECSMTKMYLSFKKNFSQRSYANCGEEAFVLAHDFKGWKKRPEYVSIDFLNDESIKKNRNHAFLLIGAKDNATAHDIKSWGDEAVVVDPWFNIVMQARDAVEFYKEKFLYKEHHEYLKFVKFKNI